MTANKFEIITKAIHAINPSAEFVLRDTNDDINIDNETFTIEWHKGDAISKADIKTKINDFQKISNKKNKTRK